MINLPKLRLHGGWCTRDYGGGSNYGAYSLRQARAIVAATRHEEPFTRQALTYSVILETGLPCRGHTYEWTVNFHPLRLRLYHVNWGEFAAERGISF